MAVMKLLPADRTAIATALRTAWDVGAGPVTLEIYDGAMPATPSTALAGQVKLGTLTCSRPLGTEAAGVLTFSAITQDDQADASGTAAWARLVDGAGVPRALFDVTNTAGAGVVKMNTVTIVQGGPIRVDSFTVTIGG